MLNGDKANAFFVCHLGAPFPPPPKSIDVCLHLCCCGSLHSNSSYAVNRDRLKKMSVVCGELKMGAKEEEGKKTNRKWSAACSGIEHLVSS